MREMMELREEPVLDKSGRRLLGYGSGSFDLSETAGWSGFFALPEMMTKALPKAFDASNSGRPWPRCQHESDLNVAPWSYNYQASHCTWPLHLSLFSQTKLPPHSNITLLLPLICSS
jgi:hypothetical protein